MATPNKNTIAPLGSTERTNQLLGGNYFDTKTGKQTKAFVPTVNVKSYRDNPDGTTTNFLSDGSQDTGFYTPNRDGSLTFNPSSVPTSISSANLKPTAPMVLPNKTFTPTDVGGVGAMVQTTIASQKSERQRQADLELAQAKAEKSKGIQDILDLEAMVGQESRLKEREYTKEKVDEYKSQVTDFTNKLEAEQLALTRKLEDLDKNPQGLFGGGLQQEKDRIERDSLRKQADIAILGNAFQRKFTDAKAIADRKVENELAPLKAQIATRKWILEQNKDSLTNAEKRAYDLSIKEEERQYKEQELNKTKSNDYILNAVQGGAPTNLVQKAQSLYNNGASAQEIAKTLGSYSLSASERLDMEIKRANIDKIKEDALAQGIKLTKEELEKEEAKLAQIPVLEDKLRLINSIKTAKGLDSRVGINFATRRGFAISDAFGAGQDFAASVQQLTNAETLATLLELKKGGGTLGAVNEKEFETLRNAATKINSWEVKDKNGQGTGEWAIDEKTFLEEVERLQKSTENLYKSLGGSLDSISDVDSYVNQVDQTLKSTNNIYSNSGYDLN